MSKKNIYLFIGSLPVIIGFLLLIYCRTTDIIDKIGWITTFTIIIISVLFDLIMIYFINKSSEDDVNQKKSEVENEK